MENWFGNIMTEPFQAFSISHIIMLGLYILGIILFISFFQQIKNHKGINEVLRWSLFTLLLLSEISYQTWAVVNGVWNTVEHLPLHLCGIASILGMLALMTKNQKLVQITFFIGIIPAMLALVTPELPHAFPHYRFMKFFIHHMIISWTGIYLVSIYMNRRVTFKHVLETFGYLNVYALLMAAVNGALGSNYLYLNQTPEATTPLSFFGSGFIYFINLEIAACFLFTLQWSVYRAITNKKSNLEIQHEWNYEK
ncbi:YwaF family protein [Salinibacillus xinjiangensis]|uniref:TIGR02206 family membrane protein n=1 Tax=Salinibacillus xinjiangensis TaxID=1229268 RepID=A0A6G1X5P7_9BACI|nr:TIGR02206 family membrane protein [Salinibacillus xinjiangensis]MRG86262.1 TIGR02206 family membrane protein [Salinibacillus xinjiangensis]